MTKILLSVIAILASALVSAGRLDEVKNSQSPAMNQLPLNYQSASRNIKSALAKCYGYTPIITSSTYPDLGVIEVEFFQASSEVVLIAAFELRQSGKETSELSTWAPKPTFGDGYSFLSRTSAMMATKGSAVDCQEAGF